MLLLGEELDKQLRAYLTAVRSNGAIVNTVIDIGCGEGNVKSNDSNLLASNGRHIVLTKHWGKNLLGHVGFVRWRASTKAKVDIQELKLQFLLGINVVIEMEEILFV